jgi:preprotein translocase subunit SecA
VPEGSRFDQWDLSGLQTDVLTQFGVKLDIHELSQLDRREIEDAIFDQLERRYKEKEQAIGEELMRETERMIMLNVIDNQWKDNLLSMDHLKEGIGLRGYGQKDPLVEYKKESFKMFQEMMDRIEDETVRFLYFLQRVEPGEAPLPYPETDEGEEGDQGEPVGVASQPSREAQSAVLDFTRNIQRKKERELEQLQFVGGEAPLAQQPVIAKHKAGRNDPCPCGSGKKYKKCCGA